MKYSNLYHILFLSLFLCGIFVLASCKSEPIEKVDQSMPVTSTTAPTTILIPTNIVTAPKELTLNSSQKILLNVTSIMVDLGISYPAGSTEVWESVFPFKKKLVLLASTPSINYFAPTYSPDGQWIAYIESSPAIGSVGDTGYPTPPGNDSIWIMRQDGSEKQRVSQLFDSFSVRDLHYCYPVTRIYPVLNWSPDGKYIYFVDYQHYSASDFRMDYYILNVQSKESFLFNSGPWDQLYNFAWESENGQFLYESGNKYWTNQITPGGVDKSKAIISPLSSIITGGNSYLNFISGLNEPILISPNDSNNDWPLMKYDIAQKTWTKKIEYIGKNPPKIGTLWGVSFGNDEIYFIDLKNWKFAASIHENKLNDFLYYFPELKDASGNSIVSFFDKGANIIWGVDPKQGKGMYQLVDWDSLNPEKDFSIIDQYPSWSWSP